MKMNGIFVEFFQVFVCAKWGILVFVVFVELYFYEKKNKNYLTYKNFKYY